MQSVRLYKSRQTSLVMPTNKVGKIAITCLPNGLKREELNYEQTKERQTL